jgi:quercetin dioxygenase-like cupin family protein
MDQMKAHYVSLLAKEHGARKLHVHLTELDTTQNTCGYQHAHAAEEAIFLLEGEVEFTFAGQTHLVGPGQLIFFPSNVTHAERRFLTPRLKYLVIRTLEAGDEPCCCGADLSPE